MQRWKSAILELGESLSRLEVVLILCTRARTRAANRDAYGLGNDFGEDERFSQMQPHVCHRARTGQLAHPIRRDRRDGEWHLVHARDAFHEIVPAGVALNRRLTRPL